MNIWDKNNMRSMNIVMDNASIHKTEYTRVLITKRRYVPVYLPPYSPFLNPIEEFGHT